MPRKPNYKFERMERERAKAQKKAARLEAKRQKAEERKDSPDSATETQGGSAGPDR